MKLNKVKRILALGLAMSMLFSVAACGQKDAAGDSSSGDSASDISSSDDSSSEGSSDEPVVVNMWRGMTTDNYIDEDNETWQKLHATVLEEANIDLQISYFDWGDSYNQKLTMYASAGDLPSGIWLFSPGDIDIINKMGENGMLHDWTEVVYDTENYPTLLENAGEQFVEASKSDVDGKLYGYPSETHAAYPHAPGGISLRKDWLEEVGMDYPANEDDLYAVIKAFAENIKDVNGNSITPVSFPQWDNFIFWLNSWIGTSMWYEDGDTINYGKYANQEGLEAALVFLNKLWNEGLMDKESFTQTGEQYIAKGINGQFGVSTFSYSYTYSINDAFYAEAPDTNKYIVSCPTFSCYDGLEAENVNSVEITSSPFNRVAVTKNGISDEQFKQIAKAIDWIGTYDASLMLLMGFEDEDWYYDEETDRKMRTEEWTQKVTERSTYQYNSGLCLWSSLNSNAGAMYDLLNCICVRPSDVESVMNIKGHQVAITFLPNVLTAGPVEEEKMGLIEDEWKQMVVSAISAGSEKECREIIAAWPETMEALGYSEIVAEKMELCGM